VDANLDAAARLAEAIGIQRRRLWGFKTQKEPNENQFNEAMKVMALLLKEARQLAKDGFQFTKSLTVDQQREVIIAWFLDLPAAQRRQFLSELEAASSMKAVRNVP